MHEAMNDPTAQTPHYSPLLHNAILSVALCYADEEHLRFPGTRKIFAQQAKRFIDNDCANPTVATVQGLVTLSSYHSLEGEYNLGWIYVGQGSRVAQARGSSVFGCISIHLLTLVSDLLVGLHLDPSELVSTGKLSATEATEVSSIPKSRTREDHDRLIFDGGQRIVVFWSTVSQETAWSPFIGRVGAQVDYT
jgi:hypothetical protein